MPDYKPLYRYSFEEARRLGEVEQWRESQAENRRCRDFLDQKVRENFDGMHLKGDIVEDAVAEFGHNRVSWVLSSHVQHYDYDGRFSSQNKAWAKETYIQRPTKEEMRRDQFVQDHTTDYLLNSHAVLVDSLAQQYRKLFSDMKLFDKSHCSPDKDYEGKVLVLKPECLKDEYKRPEYQLFLARTGFGCNPGARGQAVIGQFLFDGEHTQFRRSDFTGALDDAHLPEWAVQKLSEISQGNSFDVNNDITMKG